MYADASARERAIRVALADPDAALKLEESPRGRLPPTKPSSDSISASAYSHNALWQAGHLALDAFWALRQPQDKETCVRCCKSSRPAIPTSKLAGRCPKSCDDRSLTRDGSAIVEPAHREHRSPPSEDCDDREIRRRCCGCRPRHDRARRRSAIPRRAPSGIPAACFSICLAQGCACSRRSDDPLRKRRRCRSAGALRAAIPITTRVVLDAAGVTSYSVYPLYGPYRLVIDWVRAGRSARLSRLSRRRFSTLAACDLQRSSPAVGPQHRLSIVLRASGTRRAREPSRRSPRTHVCGDDPLATEAPANRPPGLSLAALIARSWD